MWADRADARPRSQEGAIVVQHRTSESGDVAARAAQPLGALDGGAKP